MGLAAFLLLLGNTGLHTAIANGDTRSISMHHLHTKENLTITYKVNGRYDDAALKKLNWFLRDWRRNEETRMDPRLIDVLWEVQRDLDNNDAIHIIGGYRAPETNNMLRRRSSGVAQHSQHTVGKAIDFYIPGVRLDALRAAGLRLQRGGVGFYPTSGSPFVHMDIGSIRHWPRMTHDQLVKVFPDGRTVHVPSDGRPLKNYALALADVQKRGSMPSATSLGAAQTAGINTKRSFAGLFGFGKKAREVEEEVDTQPAKTPQVASTAALKPQTPKTIPFQIAQAEPPAAAQSAERMAAGVPLPKARPTIPTTAPIQVAAVVPVPAGRPVRTSAQPSNSLASAGGKAVTPNDVIGARGYWQGIQDTPTDTPPARRIETASADPLATGSLGPWANEMPSGMTGNLAYAFASPAEPKEGFKSDLPARAAPMGNALPRTAAVAADTTVALKSRGGPSDVRSPVDAERARAVAGTSRLFNNPWLRATMLTPSVAYYMNTTMFGAPDMRGLQPLLQRPSAAVVMTFSDNTPADMSYDRFTGAAVSFVAVKNFNNRAAALR